MNTHGDTCDGDLASIAGDQSNGKRKITIGVIVPSLEFSGGVQSIVEMLIKQIECSETHNYLLVSLATSAADESSSRIRKPLSLLTGPIVKNVVWRGRQMLHVGCSLAEFEFMRYRQRSSLTVILSKCDLIQVVGGFPAWGTTVLGCGKPVAVWAATRCVWERRRLLKANKGLITYWRRLMTNLINRLDDLVIRESDSMMVMNPLMRDYATMLKGNRQGTVVFTPPGVDTSWFMLGTERLPGNGHKEDPYILSVGRFGDARKNPEFLLEAYVLLKKALHLLPKLILAGSSAPPASFWLRVNELGLSECVIFCEKPDDAKLRSLYQGALCLALSSDEEGFGMVIVEAMACGIPAVSTRCGGPDGIINDGEDGYLVDIGDAGALAERLFSLCSDLRLNRQMGLQARRNVENRFSEQATRKVFFDTWGKLLDLSYEK
jgi:glycosyltransferase involved in cell wall biosynthesis